MDTYDKLMGVAMVVLLVFAIAGVLALVVFIVFQVLTPVVCQANAEAMSLEWKWTITSGCYVNTPELGWWRLSEYQHALDLR